MRLSQLGTAVEVDRETAGCKSSTPCVVFVIDLVKLCGHGGPVGPLK